MGLIERKIVHGYELIEKNVVKVDFSLKRTGYSLLKGFVLNPIGEKIANVAIEVTLIDNDYSPPKKKIIGVTFSNIDGSYAISIPVKKGYSYEIVTYP